MKEILLMMAMASTPAARESTPGKWIMPNDSSIHYVGWVNKTVTFHHAKFSRSEVASPYNVDAPGCQIQFKTASKNIRLSVEYADKAKLVNHSSYSSMAVVLKDGNHLVTFTRGRDSSDPQTIALPPSTDGKDHVYQVLLPIADHLIFKGLNLDKQATLAAVPEPTGPRYVAYGDSITQGFLASSSEHSYPYRVAQAKKYRLIDFGFGGHRVTPSDGNLVAGLNPDLVTILLGINDCLGQVPVETFTSLYRQLLDNIRKGHPDIPIYVITPLNVPGRWKGSEKIEEFRQAITSLVKDRHDKNLVLIAGPDLIPDNNKYFPDGLHPNDLGFKVMAENLVKKMK